MDEISIKVELNKNREIQSQEEQASKNENVNGQENIRLHSGNQSLQVKNDNTDLSACMDKYTDKLAAIKNKVDVQPAEEKFSEENVFGNRVQFSDFYWKLRKATSQDEREKISTEQVKQVFNSEYNIIKSLAKSLNQATKADKNKRLTEYMEEKIVNKTFDNLFKKLDVSKPEHIIEVLLNTRANCEEYYKYIKEDKKKEFVKNRSGKNADIEELDKRISEISQRVEKDMHSPHEKCRYENMRTVEYVCEDCDIKEPDSLRKMSDLAQIELEKRISSYCADKYSIELSYGDFSEGMGSLRTAKEIYIKDENNPRRIRRYSFEEMYNTDEYQILLSLYINANTLADKLELQKEYKEKFGTYQEKANEPLNILESINTSVSSFESTHYKEKWGVKPKEVLDELKNIQKTIDKRAKNLNTKLDDETIHVFDELKERAYALVSKIVTGYLKEENGLNISDEEFKHLGGEEFYIQFQDLWEEDSLFIPVNSVYESVKNANIYAKEFNKYVDDMVEEDVKVSSDYQTLSEIEEHIKVCIDAASKMKTNEEAVAGREEFEKIKEKLASIIAEKNKGNQNSEKDRKIDEGRRIYAAIQKFAAFRDRIISNEQYMDTVKGREFLNEIIDTEGDVYSKLIIGHREQLAYYEGSLLEKEIKGLDNVKGITDIKDKLAWIAENDSLTKKLDAYVSRYVGTFGTTIPYINDFQQTLLYIQRMTNFFYADAVHEVYPEILNDTDGLREHINDMHFDKNTITEFRSCQHRLSEGKNALNAEETGKFLKTYFDIYSANETLGQSSGAEKELLSDKEIPTNESIVFNTRFVNLDLAVAAQWFDNYESQLINDFDMVVEGFKNKLASNENETDFATFFAFNTRAGIKLNNLNRLKSSFLGCLGREALPESLNCNRLNQKLDEIKAKISQFDNRKDKELADRFFAENEMIYVQHELRINNNLQTDFEDAQRLYKEKLGSAEEGTGILGAFRRIEEVSPLKKASDLFSPIENTIALIKSLEGSDNPDYKTLKTYYGNLIEAADTYLKKRRDPWFSTGERRLAAVQNLYNNLQNHIELIEQVQLKHNLYDAAKGEVKFMRDEYNKLLANKNNSPEIFANGYRNLFLPYVRHMKRGYGAVLDTKEGIDLLREIQQSYSDVMKFRYEKARIEGETLKNAIRAMGKPSELSMEKRYQVWMRCREYEDTYSDMDTWDITLLRNQYIDNEYGEELIKNISREAAVIDKIEQNREENGLNIMKVRHRFKEVGNMLDSKELENYKEGRELLAKYKKIQKEYDKIKPEEKDRLFVQETGELDKLIDLSTRRIKSGAVLTGNQETYGFFGYSLKGALAEIDFFLKEFKEYRKSNPEVFDYYEHQRDMLKGQFDIYIEKQYIDSELKLDSIIVDDNNFEEVKKQIDQVDFINSQGVDKRYEKIIQDDQGGMLSLKPQEIIDELVEYYFTFENEKKLILSDEKLADDAYVQEYVKKQQIVISERVKEGIYQADDNGMLKFKKAFENLANGYALQLYETLGNLEESLRDSMEDNKKDIENTACYFAANTTLIANIKNFVSQVNEWKKVFKKKKVELDINSLEKKLNDVIRLGNLSKVQHGLPDESSNLEKIHSDSVKLRYFSNSRVMDMKIDLVDKMENIHNTPLVEGSTLTIMDYARRLKDSAVKYPDVHDDLVELSSMLESFAAICTNEDIIEIIRMGDKSRINKLNQLTDVLFGFNNKAKNLITRIQETDRIINNKGKKVYLQDFMDEVFAGFEDFMTQLNKLPAEAINVCELQDTKSAGLDYVFIRNVLGQIASGELLKKKDSEKKVISAIKTCQKYENKEAKAAIEVRNTIEYPLYVKFLRSWLEANLNEIIKEMSVALNEGNQVELDSLKLSYREKSALYRSVGVKTQKLDNYVSKIYGA